MGYSCHNVLKYLLLLFGLVLLGSFFFFALGFFTLPPAPESGCENRRSAARGAEPCLQMNYKRGVPVLYIPQVSLQNLTIGFGNCPVLLLLLINAKEEIKLLFILYPSSLGKFLSKSREERALLNPLKIGVSAPGSSVFRALFVLGSSLAALQVGEMVDYYNYYFCQFIALFWIAVVLVITTAGITACPVEAPALVQRAFWPEGDGAHLMLLGLLGKQRLMDKFLHTNSNAQATKSPFFSYHPTEHLLLHLRCSHVGFWLGFVVLSSFLSCAGDLSLALWITCSWTCFHTFLVTYLTEGIIKNYEPGDIVGTVGWRKLFSLLRLCYKQSLPHFGQNCVWQKENRTVNLMRIYVCWVSLSLYTVYHGIWVIKERWLMYLYRPRSDPEPLLSFENLRSIYLDFLSLSLKLEWKKKKGV